MWGDDIPSNPLSFSGRSYSVIHNQIRFLDLASKHEKRVLSDLTSICYKIYVEDLKRYLAQNDIHLVIVSDDDNFEIPRGRERSANEQSNGEIYEDEIENIVSKFDWQLIK